MGLFFSVLVLIYQQFMAYRQEHPGPTDDQAFGRWVRQGGVEFNHRRNNNDSNKRNDRRSFDRKRSYSERD